MELKIHENGLAAVVEWIGDLDGSVTLRPEEESRLHALFRPVEFFVDQSKVAAGLVIGRIGGDRLLKIRDRFLKAPNLAERDHLTRQAARLNARGNG